MNQFKKFFYLKKLSTRELSTLSLLLAIAVIMGLFFTFRIGNLIKIPTKFIPIAISSMLFGPIWGGLTGLLADTFSYLLNPTSGMFMPQITFVEFLYGFTYGLFLRYATSSSKSHLRAILCILFQIVFLHLLLTTYFLVPVIGATFKSLLISRLPAAGINAILQSAGLFIIIKNSTLLHKFSGGNKS